MHAGIVSERVTNPILSPMAGCGFDLGYAILLPDTRKFTIQNVARISTVRYRRSPRNMTIPENSVYQTRQGVLCRKYRMVRLIMLDICSSGERGIIAKRTFPLDQPYR